MNKLMTLIKNYGSSCEWVSYHRIVGVSENDSIRVRCEKRRDEDLAKIRHYLQKEVKK